LLARVDDRAAHALSPGHWPGYPRREAGANRTAPAACKNSLLVLAFFTEFACAFFATDDVLSPVEGEHRELRGSILFLYLCELCVLCGFFSDPALEQGFEELYASLSLVYCAALYAQDDVTRCSFADRNHLFPVYDAFATGATGGSACNLATFSLRVLDGNILGVHVD